MKAGERIIFIWMGCMLLLTSLHASQITSATASYALPFTGAYGTARAAGMGWAFVALADDASALLWNPAGLGQLQDSQLEAFHNSWFADTSQEQLLAAFPLATNLNLGVGASYFNWGNYLRRDNLGNVLGSFNDQDWQGSFGLGLALSKNLYLGAGLQLLDANLSGQSNFSIAGSLGALWKPVSFLSLGLAWDNAGTALQGFTRDGSLRAGASLFLPYSRDILFILSGGGLAEAGGNVYVPAGFEFSYKNTFFVRDGYVFNLQDNQVQGLTGLAIGLGLAWQGLEVDYAFQPFGELGTSQRVSLLYHFSPKKAASQDSSRSEALRVHGLQSFKAGRYVEAQGYYQRALELDRNNAQAWQGLGNCYYELGRKEQAIQAYEEELRLQPDNEKLKKALQQYKSR